MQSGISNTFFVNETVTTTAHQMRSFKGAAIWSYGFRPFFLFGAAWAALALALWLPFLTGLISLPIAYSPVQWHVHELVYGYVSAVIAGFLLTAVPNWTGRLPVVGTPLMLLFAVWVAGRAAILTSAWIGAPAAAAIDLAFLLLLALAMAREIIASGNWKNLRVLAVVALCWFGNAVFHAEAMSGAETGYGLRIGIAAVILLIALIGGRIIPSFTRNWLAQRRSSALPAPFDRVDMVAMAVTGVALGIWIAAPQAQATAAAASLAALINVYRLIRWRGIDTFAEPLVTILHIGFAFIPLGFALLALGVAVPNLIASTGALHGWTAGAIGVMTLAVMTRASLGHTGQPLTATWPIQAIYAAIIVAALARIIAAFDVMRDAMLLFSTASWIAAFTGFCIFYGPLLLRARR